MGPSAFVIVVAVGITIGFVIGWLAADVHGSRRWRRRQLKSHSQLAALTETLDHRSTALATTQSRLEQQREALTQANDRLLEVSQARSNAEGRLERLAALEETLNRREAQLTALNETVTGLRAHQAELEATVAAERAAAQEKIALLQDIRTRMIDTYKAISSGTLQESTRAFGDLANASLSKYLDNAKADMAARGKAVEQVVAPVTAGLDRLQEYIHTVERARESAYGGLSQQVTDLLRTQHQLKKETGNLARALRVPHVRGRWGEITLRRVVELAGMVDRCDFQEQKSATSSQGLLRPDMVVRLPGNRQVVVDAKVPLTAYLDSLEAESESDVSACLQRHGRQLQEHVQALARKRYWRQFQPSPEFVVLFIPGENFFSAALTHAPHLIEYGAERSVVLATPASLIALLKTVAFAWRSEQASENTRAIAELGGELYERLFTLVKHMNTLGRDIERCITTYNTAVGSFERRVLTSARKFGVLGVASKTGRRLSPPDPIVQKPRPSVEEETP